MPMSDMNHCAKAIQRTYPDKASCHQAHKTDVIFPAHAIIQPLYKMVKQLVMF